MVYLRMIPFGLWGGNHDTTTLLAEEGTALMPAGGPGSESWRGEKKESGGWVKCEALILQETGEVVSPFICICSKLNIFGFLLFRQNKQSEFDSALFFYITTTVVSRCLLILLGKPDKPSDQYAGLLEIAKGIFQSFLLFYRAQIMIQENDWHYTSCSLAWI